MLGKKLGVLVILSPLFRLADSIMRSCDQRSPINPNRDPLNPPDVESCAGQAPGSNTPVKPHDQLFPSVSPLSSLSKLGESPIKACRAKVLDEANRTCFQGQLLFGNTDHPKRPLTTNSEAGWHLEKRKKMDTVCPETRWAVCYHFQHPLIKFLKVYVISNSTFHHDRNPVTWLSDLLDVLNTKHQKGYNDADVSWTIQIISVSFFGSQTHWPLVSNL